MTPSHVQRRATPEAAALQALVGEVGVGLQGDLGAAAFARCVIQQGKASTSQIPSRERKGLPF